MIVKNEAHVIRRCLRSVRPFIDSYSISDTGSTDNTMELIREELAGIPGVLVSDPWQDFGTNRQTALERCVGDHVLFIDADETLECTDAVLRLPSEYDGFTIRLVQSTATFLRTVIIRNDPRWRWRRKIHEELVFDGAHTTLNLHSAVIRSYDDSHRNLLGDKFVRDLAVLESMPPTQENVFYLAQTLFGLNRYAEAIQKYEERAALGGWEEEVYYSLFMAGTLRTSYSADSFETKAASLFRAFIYRPQRMEALSALCQLLRENGKNAEAYRLSLVEPKPTTDTHFASPRAGWRIFEEHALAAYFLEMFEEARRYFVRILEFDLNDEDRDRTLANIGYCDAKLL